MANFLVTHKITEKEEGGFSLRSADPGGYTYKGLTKSSHPSFTGWGRVADWVTKYGGPRKAQGKLFPDPTLDKLVADYYNKNYWQNNNLSMVADQFIANHMFDFLVNSGKAAMVINEAFGIVPSVNKITVATLAAINKLSPAKANSMLYNARSRYVNSLTMEFPKGSNRYVKVVSKNRGLLDRVDRFKEYRGNGVPIDKYGWPGYPAAGGKYMGPFPFTKSPIS